MKAEGVEIAAVGSEDFVLGFRLAGVRQVHAVPPGEGTERVDIRAFEKEVEAFFGARRGKAGILVLHNDDFNRVSPVLRRKLVNSVDPVVVAIGKVEEVDLRERIKQALGVDLWAKKG